MCGPTHFSKVLDLRGSMPVVPGLEMLKYLEEGKGLRQANFIGTVGSRSYVNQIFTGRRKITAGVEPP